MDRSVSLINLILKDLAPLWCTLALGLAPAIANVQTQNLRKNERTLDVEELENLSTVQYFLHLSFLTDAFV